MQAFHNTPSLGYIAWQDVHIQYKGTTYSIPDGNTDKRFVIWRYADPDCFYGSDEFPTLGPDDLLVFLNKNGAYAIVPKTQIVDGSLIVSDSIMTDALAANSVTTEKIAAGAITADLIAVNAIGAGAIAAGAVTADKIAAGEIATTHLAALAVTADKIAANSISADKIAANAIGAEKIAAGAISADKLAAGAVTAEKIAAGAISTDKLSIGLADTIEATPRTIAPDTETYFPFDGGLASTRGIQPTFTRPSAATNPDTGATVAANEPRFVEGRFGKAVLVEEGTTNCWANPTEKRVGYEWTYATTQVLKAGETWTLSFDVKRAADSDNAVRVAWATTFYIPLSQVTDEYQRFSFTITPSADTSGATYLLTNSGSFWFRNPQLEQKPYATSFVDGTRANEWLILPAADVLQAGAGTIEGWILVNDQIAGHLGNAAFFTHANGTWPANSLYMARLSTGQFRVRFNTLVSDATPPVALVPGQWLHFAYRWNADAVSAFLDGQLLTEVSNTAPDISFGPELHIGGYTSGTERANTRFCGLRIHRRALADEEIAAHAQAAAAPYDPRSLVGAIDADVRTVTALGNQIRLDSTGLKMKNSGVANVMMHLDANRLGFWDNHGEVAIGLGDVADMAAALGSDMEYGLLINQGAIVAPESVIRASLALGAVGQKHLTQGSVTLRILSELLSVSIPDRLQALRDASMLLTNPGFETGNLSGWTGTGTVGSAYAYTGAYGVKDPDLYQDVPVRPGQRFQAWFYARAITPGSTAYITMSFLNASKSVLSTVSGNYSPNANSFAAVPYASPLSGTAPTNTAYVRVRIHQSGSIMADTVVLTSNVTSGGTIGTAIGTDYALFMSATIPKAECCEQVKVSAEIQNNNTIQVTVQVRINGDIKSTASSSSDPAQISTLIDVRSYAQDLNIAVYAKAATAGSAFWHYASVYQNQRLPLRAVAPLYAVTDTAQASCSTPCEMNCQASCQSGCQSSCQSTCQDSCQSECQSICEQTSQGGGCWVAGTPVTIYDPGKEVAYEIPVERLEPGMQMPYYDPATDTLAITECLSNQRSYTHTVFVAEVEGGWMLEMTREQPMDVLRAHLVTGQIMWHRVQARYLRPGDKLIRPFDKTLHEVLSVRQEERTRTWVWNPRTEVKRYIVHGFADGISKT